MTRAGWKRGFEVAGIVAMITVLHYGTPPDLMYLHVLYRELYFVPIFLAALGFGIRGGLATAAGITLLYGPHVAMSIHTPESTVGNVLQILFFHIFGLVMGSYIDLKRGYRRSLNLPAGTLPTVIERRVLVWVDGTEAGLQATAFAADLFSIDHHAFITLLGISEEPKVDLFAGSALHQEATARAEAAVHEALDRAGRLLPERGVPAGHVETRLVRLDGMRLSDAILREQREGAYNAIVVGRHRLTRAQEFLFGSVAVRLAREAPCPVLIVDARTAPAPSPSTANSPSDLGSVPG